VHEQVHQRTQGQKHPRQELDHVRAVSVHRKYARSPRDPARRHPTAKAEPARVSSPRSGRAGGPWAASSRKAIWITGDRMKGDRGAERTRHRRSAAVIHPHETRRLTTAGSERGTHGESSSIRARPVAVGRHSRGLWSPRAEACRRDAGRSAKTLKNTARSPRTTREGQRRGATANAHQMERSYSHWLPAQEVVKHCRALVALDKQMAREYEALARAHAARPRRSSRGRRGLGCSSG
jgi:hypothetical protein